MLIKKNLKDKDESIYCCDRCKRKIKINQKASLYVQISNKTIKKRWDLCAKCFKLLIIGIEKGKKNES